MIRESDLAYLAGVVDSDGCIRVERLKNNGRSRDGISYAAFITIQQVERQAIDLARATFGGFVMTIKPTPKMPLARTMVRWTARSRIAADALAALRPYLRIKTAQADNAIALACLVVELNRARYDGFGAPRYRLPAELDRLAAHFETSRRLNSGAQQGMALA